MAQVDDRLFNVDRHGSLRVPGAMWIAFAFLARHLILVAIVFAMAKRSPDAVRLLGQGFAWLVLPLEIPVTALMLAGANRSPQSGRWLRIIWHRGRTIVLATVAVHLVWVGWVLSASDVWRTWPELFLASCSLLDFAIAYSVLKDDYYKQLFADFPAPEAASQP